MDGYASQPRDGSLPRNSVSGEEDAWRCIDELNALLPGSISCLIKDTKYDCGRHAGGSKGTSGRPPKSVSRLSRREVILYVQSEHVLRGLPNLRRTLGK